LIFKWDDAICPVQKLPEEPLNYVLVKYMKDCEEDFLIHYTYPTDKEYNKIADKWMDDNIPDLQNEKKYKSKEITLDTLSRENITLAASLIATKRCYKEKLVIDKEVMKRNTETIDKDTKKVNKVPFYEMSLRNMTVLGNQSCTFTVENDLDIPEPVNGEYEEGKMNLGGVSFMFNEGLKILVSVPGKSNHEWDKSEVEKYEELTEEKLGQIFVGPKETRRFVLINLSPDPKRIVVFLGGAVSSLAFMAGSLNRSSYCSLI